MKSIHSTIAAITILSVIPTATFAVPKTPSHKATPAVTAFNVLTIPAQGGPIRITPIFHASLQIEYRGKVIQVDPFSQGDYSHAKKADLIFITHSHGDHFDPKEIAQISGGFVHIIAPPVVAQQLNNPKSPKTSVTPLSNGSIYNFQTNDASHRNAKFRMSFLAVPAYNLKRGPKPGQFFHPKGQFNGYVLTLGGKRIYIAGDTEAVPEMKKLKNIDVAFLPMNLPFTMTPSEAANAVRAFRPKLVVPYHYRYPFDKPNTNPQQFQASLRGSGIVVRLLQMYPPKH